MSSERVLLELRRQPVDIKSRRRLEGNTHDEDTTTKSAVNATTISRRACSELNYNDFYWQHMQANWPVLLTGVSNAWECQRHWIKRSNTSDDANNTNIVTSTTPNTAINCDYLREKVGDCEVPVANCGQEYYNSHAKCEMRFYDFLDYWQQDRKTSVTQQHNHYHQQYPPYINENSNFVSEQKTTDNTENLYLKDWHLKSQMPDYDFYTVPKYFASDWLNEYLLDTGKDDYRFVYMGPKDTWTPFHADVFGSYSWSTNILGCKRWILLPPGEESRLKDKLGNFPQRIDAALLSQHSVHHYIIDQLANEALFVPSGWYHQVDNVSDTISVNHNWFNACNVLHIWQNLSTSMQQVIDEIEDCRQMENFDEHCHTMLRASFGLNFYDFLNILEHITCKRVAMFANYSSSSNSSSNNNNNNDEQCAPSHIAKYLLFDTFTLNDYHVRHDLQSIHAVVQAMLQNAVICDSRADLYRSCTSLAELTKQY